MEDGIVEDKSEESSLEKAKNKKKQPTCNVATINNDTSSIARKFEILALNDLPGGFKHLSEAKSHKYAFWNTQPVPRIDEVVSANESIEPHIEIADVRTEPFSLPDMFYWNDLDLTKEDELKELYELLSENYVEDDDNMFRFDYKPEFIRWALQPPGWRANWHLSVRSRKSDKLLAFISAIPSDIRVYEKVLSVVDINFLCVHKKLRSKRVAPVLIREITRRVNLTGIFQAVFTAGVVLPKPIAICRYWHRSLNPKKLIEVKFSHMARNMTMRRTLKLYQLPQTPKTKNLEMMKNEDMGCCHSLLTVYLSKFDLAPLFSREEFEHFFASRERVIYCYVVKNDEGQVTDFLSFYEIPSSVMHHQQYKSIRAAYSFYNVANSIPLVQMMNDALILAHNNGFDVFNALDLMDNKEFLEELKFGIGDGNLQYYLYNWRCPEMEPAKVGLVLQ